MVKTLPPNAIGGVGLILGQGTNISYDLWPKTQNIKQSNSQKRVLIWSTLKGSLKKSGGKERSYDTRSIWLHGASILLFSCSVMSNSATPWTATCQDCNKLGFLVLHHLLELAQTHIH